jgi:uncharacterized hydrophobic protein (TIGR00271 family)
VQGLTQADVVRMRGALFFEEPGKGRRLSKFWLLLMLAGAIAAAGIVSDSTATVIGAMIVAPLMTPILGIVLGVSLGDGANLRRCVALVVAGAAAVVAEAWLAGLLVPYPIVAETNSQVAARVTPRLVDLVAALATGAVGSIALARDDISDALPGVAIAISLVPPLSVVGLTFESGAHHQALGALLLFLTNVAAILASGLVVMAIYHTHRVQTSEAFRSYGSVAIVAVLLAAVIVPLWINTDRIDKTTVRESEVQAVSQQWATSAGWAVLGVSTRNGVVLVDAAGPAPAPRLVDLRHGLSDAGLGGLSVRVHLTPGAFVPVTAGSG